MNPFIQTDLMADMRTLPLAALIVVTLLGIGLFTTGWAFHRFWLTLTATFIGGIIGLRTGPQTGIPPVVCGMLAAVAGGCLSLALARVAVFLIYGLIACHLVTSYAPRFDVPFACFLVGGLVSILAYRLCVRLLTCAAGAAGLIYGGLILMEKIIKFDSIGTFSKLQANQLNLVFAITVGGGIVSQLLVDRVWEKYKKNRKDLESMRQKQQAPKPAGGGSGGKGKAIMGWFRKAA